MANIVSKEKSLNFSVIFYISFYTIVLNLYMQKKLLINLIKNEAEKFFNKSDIGKILEQVEKFSKEIFISNRVLSNIQRIFENDYFIPIYAENVNSFLIYLKITLKISSYSNYLTDIVVRNPEFLTRILSTNILYENKWEKDFEHELKQKISIFKTIEKKTNALIRFRREHILRIGLRDIFRIVEFKQIAQEYSRLTKVILDVAFQLALTETRKNYPIKKLPNYCLISLGKLGGYELNYSSDVDLICVYDNPLPKYQSEVLEFYDKVVKKFIEICTKGSSEGYLFRIDFRLRPDGKYSPLARSINYYFLYYETHSRFWERQMLIKMNFISGNEELFHDFKSHLKNFIYPKTFFESPSEFILRLKYDEEKLNVKHFAGGIRDIEFAVQALQLLNGGKIQELQIPNTIDAIEKLNSNKILSDTLANRLIKAYTFLRRIENFIQLMDDQQTHLIPTDEDKLMNLSFYLNLNSKEKLIEELEKQRKFVHSFYRKILGKKTEIGSKINSLDFEKEENRTKLREILRLFSENLVSSEAHYDKLFQKFKNSLIIFLKKESQRDRWLENFSRLVYSFSTKSHYTNFLQNPNFYNQVFQVCKVSPRIIEKIVSSQFRLDLFHSGLLFNNLFSLDFFKKFNLEDFETLILNLQILIATRKLSFGKLSDVLVKFYDQILSMNAIQLVKKFKIDLNDFVIISLGSYGSKEMNIHSDIDLLFIFNENVNVSAMEKFPVYLLNNLRNQFSLAHYFKIDSRLRPEGSTSPIGWSIDQFKNYIQKRMRIWELFTYLKARPIYGNPQILNELINDLKVRINNIDKTKLIKEAITNRNLLINQKSPSEKELINLKFSPGGLMDLQLFTQLYAVLNNDFWQNSPISSLKIFEMMGTKKFLKRKDVKILINNYKFLLNSINLISSIEDKQNLNISTKYENILIKKLLQIPLENSIYDFTLDILRLNQKIIETKLKELLN